MKNKNNTDAILFVRLDLSRETCVSTGFFVAFRQARVRVNIFTIFIHFLLKRQGSENRSQAQCFLHARENSHTFFLSFFVHSAPVAGNYRNIESQ